MMSPDNRQDPSYHSETNEYKEEYDPHYEEDPYDYQEDPSLDPLHEKYYRETKERQRVKAPSREEIKAGYSTLRGMGKPIVYFALMVIVFFVVNILSAYGIIPKKIQLGIYAVVLILIGINYVQRHAHDEDTLD